MNTKKLAPILMVAIIATTLAVMDTVSMLSLATEAEAGKHGHGHRHGHHHGDHHGGGNRDGGHHGGGVH